MLIENKIKNKQESSNRNTLKNYTKKAFVIIHVVFFEKFHSKVDIFQYYLCSCFIKKKGVKMNLMTFC